MARLRGEGGCPWDREQTRATLKPYLVEEAYEVVHAIDTGSPDDLVEELGDLLFQVVFHAQIASEQGEFTMQDVLERLTEKMTRRHPHVFGGPALTDASEALAQWERIKQDEADQEGRARSALDGVPDALPALLRARRLQVKAGRVGFDWADWQGACDKLHEELDELRDALAGEDAARIREEMGDVLFSLVNVARMRDIDAEDALRQAAGKFTRRFKEVEAEMKGGSRAVADASAEELDRAWERAKARELQGSRGSEQA